MNKQAMLNYIFDYADSLMNASGYTVLPYYDLDNSTMNRIQTYFSSDINSDNIIALISTSVFDSGKTGIVFTNYAVYTRDWGILPETDTNFLFEYDTASFTTYIMERLFEISMNDTAKEIAKDFKDIAQSFKNWLDS